MPKDALRQPPAPGDRPDPGQADHRCAAVFRSEVYPAPEALPDPGPHSVAGIVVCPHGVVYRMAPVQLDDEP